MPQKTKENGQIPALHLKAKFSLINTGIIKNVDLMEKSVIVDASFFHHQSLIYLAVYRYNVFPYEQNTQ